MARPKRPWAAVAFEPVTHAEHAGDAPVLAREVAGQAGPERAEEGEGEGAAGRRLDAGQVAAQRRLGPVDLLASELDRAVLVLGHDAVGDIVELVADEGPAQRRRQVVDGRLQRLDGLGVAHLVGHVSVVRQVPAGALGQEAVPRGAGALVRADIGQDGGQPGADLVLPRHPEAGQGAQRTEEGLLDGVLDLAVGAEQAAGPSGQGAVVVLGDDRESVGVALEVQEDELAVLLALGELEGAVGDRRDRWRLLLDRQRDSSRHRRQHRPVARSITRTVPLLRLPAQGSRERLRPQDRMPPLRKEL